MKSLYIDHTKILNHLIHVENRVTDILKNLRDKREIFIDQYKDLIPLDSRPEIMYADVKSTKLSQMTFRLLDLYCLPLAH